MNELESSLHDALHAARDNATGGLSGPALRRTARRRTYRTRTGGIAVVGAAAVTGVLVAPGLLNTPSSSSTVGAGASVTGPAKEAGTDPVGKALPMASFTGKPTPAAAPTGPAVPVQANVWTPAGSLVDDAMVQSTAPKVAATDTDWQSWGGQLLEQDTVSVVFAAQAAIRSSGPDDARPLIIVTGRT